MARPASRRDSARLGKVRRKAPPRFFEAEAGVIEGILMAAILAAPLLLGSVAPWALWVLLLLSGGLAVGLLFVPALKDRSVPWFGVVLCATVLFVAFQALSLP